jgi:hypothetical protein
VKVEVKIPPDVARASCPLSRERPAPARRGQGAYTPEAVKKTLNEQKDLAPRRKGAETDKKMKEWLAVNLSVSASRRGFGFYHSFPFPRNRRGRRD